MTNKIWGTSRHSIKNYYWPRLVAGSWILIVHGLMVVPLPESGTNLAGPVAPLAHAFLFFILGFTVAWAWPETSPYVLVSAVLASALVAETSQHLIPSRTVELLDYGLNGIYGNFGLFVMRNLQISPSVRIPVVFAVSLALITLGLGWFMPWARALLLAGLVGLIAIAIKSKFHVEMPDIG